MNTIDLPSSPSSSAKAVAKPALFAQEQRRSYILLCIVLWSVIAYLLISHFIMMNVEIKGASMSPTLLDGQRFLLMRCQYFWRAPRKGEIVVIRDPQDHDLSIKRIIGLPNQIVQIKHDGVYVNGERLAEPYLTTEAATDTGHKVVDQIKLGPAQYYVMGDNRDWSADSRIYGPVPRDYILGTINKSN